MERTIDRTSYRRSLRNDYHSVETKETSSKTFTMINFFLNEVIVAIALVIVVLAIKYFELEEVESWIKENLTGQYTITSLYGLMKSKIEYIKEDFDTIDMINISGEISGEVLLQASGEELAETLSTNVENISDDVKNVKKNYSLILPVNGVVSSRFGERESTSDLISTNHLGIDIATESGTDIKASHSGIITMAKKFSTYGNCIMINDGKLTTVYAHCSKIEVTEGQKINQGDVIGKVGMTGNATGPHLHFEIRYEDRFVNPADILGEI